MVLVSNRDVHLAYYDTQYPQFTAGVRLGLKKAGRNSMYQREPPSGSYGFIKTIYECND